MPKFRKKPVVIEAVRWTGDNGWEIGNFAKQTLIHGSREGVLSITTLEGVMTAQVGDWIIKGIQGEFYPCKNDIFEKTYDQLL